MRIYPRRHARGGALCTSPATPMATTPEAWAGKLSHFRGGLSNLPATERGTYVRTYATSVRWAHFQILLDARLS